MNLQFFPHFIRKNYPQIGDLTNAEIKEIGIAFKSYLEEVFKSDKEKLKDIWNIDGFNVMMNDGHPFKHNGYHPALIIHFERFVKLAHENLKQ